MIFKYSHYKPNIDLRLKDFYGLLNGDPFIEHYREF